MTMQIGEMFYTLTEAAALLGVERHTIWRWIKDNKLSAQRAGGVVFIAKEAVENLRQQRATFDSTWTLDAKPNDAKAPYHYDANAPCHPERSEASDPVRGLPRHFCQEAPVTNLILAPVSCIC